MGTILMACRQRCRCLPAVQSIIRGRRLGPASLDHLPPPSACLATRAFVSCHHASTNRRPPERASCSALPQGLSLSTSAGAAAGTGEGRDDTGCSSKRSSAGDAEAGISERKGGADAAAPAGAPADARGVPRARQRVEVELGTFHEFTAINKTGGKIFEASRKLIPAKDAVVFPAMEVSNLVSDESAAAASGVDFLSGVLAGRVTMVGLFHRQFGYSMLPSWREPFEEAFAPQGRKAAAGVAAAAATTPSALSLSLLESWPLRMLKPLLVNTMGRGLSPEQRASFFYRFGPTEEVRKALGIVNRLTLYVLLVDQEGRVQWQGTGKGNPEEVESLIRCARQLAAEGSSSASDQESGAEAGAGAGARGVRGRNSKKESSVGPRTARSQSHRHRGGRR